jgi:hypothetical protein
VRHNEAQRIIAFAEQKLHHLDGEAAFEKLFENYIDPPKPQNRLDISVLTCSAIVAVLVGLDLDFTSPKRAAELVASRLRWAAGCIIVHIF